MKSPLALIAPVSILLVLTSCGETETDPETTAAESAHTECSTSEVEHQLSYDPDYDVLTADEVLHAYEEPELEVYEPNPLKPLKEDSIAALEEEYQESYDEEMEAYTQRVLSQQQLYSCLVEETQLPDHIEDQILSTSAVDGRQEAEWDGFSATWTAHSVSGLDIQITGEDAE